MNNQSIYVQFYNYIPKELKKRIYVLIPFLSLTGLFEVVSLAALIPLMSFILEPNGNIYILDLLQLNELTNSQKVILLFGVYLFLMTIKGIFVFLTSRFSFSTALKVRADLQQRLFKMYLYRDFMKHLESNSTNYVRNITTECNQIEGRLVMPAITLLAEVLPVLFIISFLIFINPYGVFLAGIVFIFFGFLITYFSSKHLKEYGKEQLKSDGLQIKIATEAFDAIKEISLYKKENQILNIYKTYTDRSVSLIGKALALGQIPKLVLEVVGLIVISIIASTSLSSGSDINQVIVELTIFIGAIVKLLPSANRIVMNFQSLMHAKPAVENILIELKEIEVNIKQNILKNQKYEKLSTISCQNISVKYENRDNFVFKNVNFELTKNSIVGLKGESGSGKSTLINILLGFIKPIKGEIVINDKFYIEDNLDLWQSKISYVPQDVILFDDTLKNNILFYDDKITEKELNTIISKLRLDGLVQSLKNGLETDIGEKGSSLSGGQKQRIGIARALARKPEFIIFDEATSALDAKTEKFINEMIKELSSDTIVLIIAHKISAFEICDKVYQISDKKIIECKGVVSAK
ncbi:MAG: ABC transporter ATP-binding protein [Colwellia sp.]|nr:ABC transporter ATP-binding protein [Colwellia sp.]